jgi:hypothetical protein
MSIEEELEKSIEETLIQYKHKELTEYLVPKIVAEVLDKIKNGQQPTNERGV